MKSPEPSDKSCVWITPREAAEYLGVGVDIIEATIHWQGLRLENAFDGTAETQRPIPVGGRFSYRLTFPDPGVYWYHPHIREDYAQDMGLYGNILVEPADRNYWPPVDREVTLTLDDILIEDGTVASFDRHHPTHTAMGRFGNVLLANGHPELAIDAHRGAIVRFFLTNTANTRVFHLWWRGARRKLVGGDSGHYEREAFVDPVVIAPSERLIIDVAFDAAGEAVLEHRTPHRTYKITTVRVAPGEPSAAAGSFDTLRTNADMVAERATIAPLVDAEPAKRLALVAEMNIETRRAGSGTAIVYYCPMHPDVKSNEPGRCPRCGMTLLPLDADAAAHGHMQAGMDHDSHEMPSDVAFPSGIEWEDDMAAVNRITTPANMRWKLIDRATGKEGHDIDWRFRVGDRVKIRVVNEMDSDHPMHHPFHIHGAGRFLILSRDGVVEPNLVWKDTVLIPTGQVVDLVLEVTNPGVCMAHCHIAEHHESGMMFSFRVDP